MLLGEDETQAKNRFALICAQCRLVNGQAPPGTRELGDVGRWRCGGCGAWNGEEKVGPDADVSKLVESWKNERAEKRARVENEDGGTGKSEEQEESGRESESEGEMREVDTPARSTRSKSRAKGQGKKAKA